MMTAWREWRKSWHFVVARNEFEERPLESSNQDHQPATEKPPAGDVRSRTGCLTCKKRRKKCDEVHPVCGGCQQRQLKCEYPTGVRWVSTKTLVAAPGKRKRPEEDQINESTKSRKIEHQTSDSGENEQLSRGNRKFTTRELPFLGIIHMGAEINYAEGHEERESEDLRCSGDNGGSRELLFNQQMTGVINQAHFDSPDDAFAFAYWTYYHSNLLSSTDSPSSGYQTLSELTSASPVLLETIISLATDYLNSSKHSKPSLSLERHDRAIKSLREALSFTNSPSLPTLQPTKELSKNITALTATILQIANITFTGGNGAELHFLHALDVIRDLDYINRPPNDVLSRLLVQRYAMLDVTTAILQHHRPHLPQEFWLFAADKRDDIDEPSFHRTTGCPQPLLRIFSRLALLAADLKDGCVTEVDVLTEMSSLETDLHLFGQFYRPHSINDNTEHCEPTAVGQCFYWSAHIIAQRIIYRDSTSSPRVQHTVNNLVQAIQSLPVGCGPDSLLLFPFYVSSREAITPQHRNWVRERNRQMKEVYPSPQHDALMVLLEEVWIVLDVGCQQRDNFNKHEDVDIRDLEMRWDLCLL